MTVAEIEKRIQELEEELKSFGEDVKDATSYVQGIDDRRLLIEKELSDLRGELEKLKTSSNT